VQRPTWVERVEHGEAVNYVILFVGAAGTLCFIFQFIYLLRVRVAVSRQLRHLDRPSDDNPLGRVLGTFRGDAAEAEEDAEVVELRISEAVLREVPRLERFQAFLRLAVAAGPLLGLIGTVIGMIEIFGSQSPTGANPQLLAHGISVALYNTAFGIGIAIPALIFYRHFRNKVDGFVVDMEQQAAKLIDIVHGERAGGA